MRELDTYRSGSRAALSRVAPALSELLGQHRAVQAELQRGGRPAAERQAITAGAAARAAQIRARAVADHEKGAQALRQIRRAQGPVSSAEQAAWERLRPYVENALRSDKPAWFAAEERLKAAIADGDAAMLAAGRRMVPDALAAAGQPLVQASLDWLDMIGGDADVREAVVLEAELRRGWYHVTSALNMVDAELTEISPIPAVNLPTFDAGVIFPDGLPPAGPGEREVAAMARQDPAGVPFTPHRPAAGWGRSTGRPDAPAGDRVAVPQPQSINGPEGGRP